MTNTRRQTRGKKNKNSKKVNEIAAEGNSPINIAEIESSAGESSSHDHLRYAMTLFQRKD